MAVCIIASVYSVLRTPNVKAGPNTAYGVYGVQEVEELFSNRRGC